MLMIAFVVLAGLVAVSDAGAGDCTSCKTSNDFEAAAATCAVYKAYLQCLETHADKPCNHDANAATKVVANKTLCSDTDIPTESICKCQQTYWSAARAANTRCADMVSLFICITPLASTAKDCGDNTGDVIMTAAKAAYDGETTACSPALTATCKCEVAAGIKDKSDNTKLCNALTEELTCLGKIATTTDKACKVADSQATVNATVTALISTNKCPDSGAAENVFTATSLVLALLSTFIL